MGRVRKVRVVVGTASYLKRRKRRLLHMTINEPGILVESDSLGAVSANGIERKQETD